MENVILKKRTHVNTGSGVQTIQNGKRCRATSISSVTMTGLPPAKSALSGDWWESTLPKIYEVTGILRK